MPLLSPRQLLTESRTKLRRLKVCSFFLYVSHISKYAQVLHAGRQKSNLLAPEKSPSNRARSRSRGPATDAHQLEREWNQNHPKTNVVSPDISHRNSLHISSGISSGHRPLSRNGSSTSTHADNALSSTSTTSQNDYHPLRREKETEQVPEPERIQNKPFAGSKPRPLSMSDSLSPSEPVRISNIPTRPESRLSISSPRLSFHGHHSRSSSRASSSGSLFSLNSEYGTEKIENDHERERNWNAPRPHWHQHPSSPNPRPSSSVGLHSLTTERVRTLSFPTRPDSRLSPSSARPSRQRQASYGSSQSSSRASSPPGSSRSVNSVDADQELLHGQERNWNSPRPHWNDHTRSNSSGHGHSSPSSKLKRTQSLTQKSSPSPSPSATSHFSMDTSASARRRAESMKSIRTPPIPTSSIVPQTSLSSISTKRISLSRPHNHPPRPNSPLPPLNNSKASLGQADVAHSSSHSSPSSKSRSRDTHSPDPTRSPLFSREIASASPSPSQRKSTIKSSQIPVRTSSKAAVLGTVLFPNSKTNDRELQEVGGEVKPQIPNVHLELAEDENDNENEKNMADGGDTDTDTEAEESNEVVQESTPTLRPNGVLPLIENSGASEVSSVYTSFESEARLQKIITSPPSPPLSSPSDGPSTPEAEASHSMLSFPSTPPKDSHYSTKLEFQTPSPPKNLPDLPGPPSSTSSSDEDHASNHPVQGNLSSLKTPKPPGAWTTTPLPPRAHTLLRSNSLPTDDENDSGLATPAASLSRAATMPPRTPALPGGWMNTPANRKSVRFQEESMKHPTDPLKTELVASKLEEVVNPTENSPGNSPPKFKAAMVPDAQTSTSKNHSPRKVNGVRMVDSFGRTDQKIGSLRNNSIRIVDAMGRVIEDSLESGPSTTDGVPPSRKDALDLVRNGLHSLAEEMKDEEGLIHITNSEDSRNHIRRLERVSQEARESRLRLTSEIFSNVENIKKKLAPLRASMQQSTSLVAPPPDRRSNGRHWLLWVLAQIFIVYAMYRAAAFYARKMFITTYYDPLYPDLFFYTLSPTNYCSSPPIAEILQREGFGAAARQALAYVAIFFSSWQSPCQWQGSYQGSNSIWPPT
ncbi:hypothetical protein DFJ43DRAFT_186816 [Lentinula guzmanii]|uniref:Uncharacterized protein n=1 Tax=Lentinula guzmanii TaxID=2804957 RepID=A0AA38JQF9_9AGAR|nr:hypothetical protein DFJ43DRAFT_186816 [Lentinula guzmanii]